MKKDHNYSCVAVQLRTMYSLPSISSKDNLGWDENCPSEMSCLEQSLRDKTAYKTQRLVLLIATKCFKPCDFTRVTYVSV